MKALFVDGIPVMRRPPCTEQMIAPPPSTAQMMAPRHSRVNDSAPVKAVGESNSRRDVVRGPTIAAAGMVEDRRAEFAPSAS